MASPAKEPGDALHTRLVERLDLFRKTIQLSKLLEQTHTLLKDSNITKIRCLALGSPTESTPALYQLAYVLEIAEKLDVLPRKVSHHDPVFTNEDKLLLHSVENVVEEEYKDPEPASTLYFLPHAGLDLTNVIIESWKPRLLLANNLITHTDRISKLKLHEQYPQLSLLANLVALPNSPKEDTSEFTTVVRKQRKNRKNATRVFQPPKIEYDYSEAYFTAVKVEPLDNLEGPWLNAFTDLTLHIIQVKDDIMDTKQ